MCYFCIVIKLLVLKILLSDLIAVATAARYDYGYHPSAEEYDNLLSETRRYWTHAHLKNERDKLMAKSNENNFNSPENRATYESRYFTPKFQYETNEAKKYNNNKQHNPKTPATRPLQTIGSTLEFNYNSNELPQPLFNTTFKIQPATAYDSKESSRLTKPLQLDATDIVVKPLVKPLIYGGEESSTKRNYTQEEGLPIYFTNPATGIVYAITELGQSHKNLTTTTNGSIPIFITKEQYERDIFQLKNIYEQKCKNRRTLTTTAKPITRLKKPLANIIPITSAQFSPNTLKKPKPVMVQTELVVQDEKPAPARPTRKRKTKPKPVSKPKRKIKKQKPPGHKILGTTIRPLLANRPEGPAIILGTRTLAAKPYKSLDNVATQLEKPNFESIFSSTTHQSAAEVETTSQHRLHKRSADDKPKYLAQNSPTTSNTLRENVSKRLAVNYLRTRELKNIILKNVKKISNFETPSKFRFKQFSNALAKIIQNNKYYNRDLKLFRNTFEKEKFPNTQLPIKLETKNLFVPATKENFKKVHNKNVIGENYLKTVEERNLLKSPRNQDFKTSNLLHKKLSAITHSFKKNKILDNLKDLEINISNKQVLPSAVFEEHKKVSALADTSFNRTKEIQVKLNALKSRVLASKNFANFVKANKNELLKNLYENITSTTNNSTHNLFQTSTEINLKSSTLNIKKGDENPTFPQPNFKHHINKRSTAPLAKVNATLPKLKKPANKTLDATPDPKNSKNQTLDQIRPASKASSIISTKTTNSSATRLQRPAMKITKRLKKRKRLAKIKRNRTSSSQTSLQPRSHKRVLKKNNKKGQKKPQGKQDTEYYIFDIEESYEEDDEDEEDDDSEEVYVDEEGHEEVQPEADILAYDSAASPTHTSEAGLSNEEINNDPSPTSFNKQNKKQATYHSDMAEAVLEPSLLDYENDENGIDFKTQAPYVKKRFRRRPPRPNDYDYEDDDDDDEHDNSIAANLGGFFRMIFYPIQMVMGSVMDSFGSKDNSMEEDSPYTQYTSYHKTLKQQQQHSSEDYDDGDDDDDDGADDDYDANESSSSSLSNWFSSWFAFNRRNKKIGSTTVAPSKRPRPTKAASSWLPSWLSFGANDRISTDTASHEDYDEYDKWFASWFGEMRPKARKRTTTTTTSTTTQIPHVPILTIVDPLKNPQNWIGILAHHIINHTSTSTANPLTDIWNRVTTTTTENPEIPKKISYDKYQIWRLKPQDESQVKALEEYKKSEDGIKLQWLKGPSLRGLTDVLVPPKMLVDFQASLTFELIDHEVLIFDVGKAISYEKTKEDFFFTTTQKPKKHHGNKNLASISSMTWHKYYGYDDIIKYLETMRMRFPHLVELIHIGRSYEGRPLIVTKIESREAAAINSAHYTAHQLNKLRHKKRIGLANAVFIEAGTHGMEWIGPSTATWIINELLRIMKKNISDDQSFIRNTTWYIMPVLNPDGYVYSHEFDRFWKKSRSRHVSRPSGIINSAMTWLQKKRAREKVCFGVDLDRNWHYQWSRRGSSKSVCNEFYAGPTPFSEPETKALSEFLMDYRTQIKLFVSMQSYGQIISYPYKANTTYDAERLDELLDVAMVGTDNLRKRGSKSRYKIDSSNDLVENRSGCADAFAAYEVGIPFSYTLQLADNGVHGYLLPSASIESTARDSFDIITGMLDYI